MYTTACTSLHLDGPGEARACMPFYQPPYSRVIMYFQGSTGPAQLLGAPNRDWNAKHIPGGSFFELFPKINNQSERSKRVEEDVVLAVLVVVVVVVVVVAVAFCLFFVSASHLFEHLSTWIQLGIPCFWVNEIRFSPTSQGILVGIISCLQISYILSPPQTG